MGNSKTLTPGLGIPIMDWVHGLPTRVGGISNLALGKCNRPGFSLRLKLYHCRSLHTVYLPFLHEKSGKPQKFVFSFTLPFC